MVYKSNKPRANVVEMQERLKHATTNCSRHLCPAGFEVYSTRPSSIAAASARSEVSTTNGVTPQARRGPCHVLHRVSFVWAHQSDRHACTAT